MTGQSPQHLECPASRASPRWAWAVTGLLLAAVTAEVGVLIYRSLDWPLVQDAPLMNYMAWRLDQGDTPYRDVLDMNFPGAYAVHWAAIRVFGTSDWGFRLFDLVWLGLTMGAMVLCCRRFGWAAAGAGALLLAVFHVEGGPLRAGQREYVLIAPLLLACHLAAGYAERGNWARLLLAGVLAGVGTTIKPIALLFWAGLLVAAFLFARRRGRCPWAAAFGVGLGGLLPVGAALAWVVASGGWAGFREVLTQLLPLYSSIRRISRLGLAESVFDSRYVVALALLAGTAYAALGFRGRRIGPRAGLILMGAVYGLAHHLLQGKGWQYHLYVFVGFLCAACAARAEQASAPEPAAPPEVKPSPAPWAACVALAAAALVAGRAIVIDNDHGLPQKNRLMAELVQDISSRVGPGQTVQVMDITYGGLDALLRLKLRQPTRFIYDFPFFMDEGQPYVQALRKQFLEQLEAGKPRLIVIFERGGGWPGKDYNRLASFGELQQWLDRHYQAPQSGSEYRVYVRKESAHP